MKKFSLAIVTTVYNDSVHLKKLLLSLLAQSKHSFRHYIFDDGSIETSEEIVRWYKKEIIDRKIMAEVVYKKSDVNIGVDKGHEILFKMIKEDYFCWIDSDDWVKKDFCKTIYKNISKHPQIDIFHLNSSQFDTNNNLMVKSTMSLLSINVRNSIDQFPAYCLGGQRFFHNFVIKTDSFKRVNPSLTIFPKNNQQTFWYDAQILFEMCLFHGKYKLIKKPLSCILNRPTSVSRNERHLRAVDRRKDFESLKFIIFNLKYDKKDVELFFELFEKSVQYFGKLTWNSIKSNYEDSRQFYKKYKSYIRNLRLPSNYINLKKDVDTLFAKYKFYLIIKFAKRIISHFRKGTQS